VLLVKHVVVAQIIRELVLAAGEVKRTIFVPWQVRQAHTKGLIILVLEQEREILLFKWVTLLV